VGALLVVVGEVVVEVAAQTGVGDLVEARERRSPALFEDRAVESFDVPVGLRSAGANPGVTGAERCERAAEVEVAELVAVVRQNPLELPARGLQVRRDTAR
jgi:hypothetical protein